MKFRIFSFVAAAIAFGVVGCGASKVQVAGKVEWTDGKPAVELADGQVIFESPTTKLSARGVITKEGTFTINTEGTGDGIVPGEYQVAIVEHRPSPEGSTRVPPQHLPDKYYSFTTSGLTATVKSGPNPITLKVEKFKK